jgi:hypothetical protein
LFGRDARATVDLGSTDEIDPCPIRLLSAQAGWRIGGPGPGCFARGSECTRGRAGQPLTGRCRWAAAHKKGRVVLIQRKHYALVFNFSEVIFNRISMNLMHFKFKFD